MKYKQVSLARYLALYPIYRPFFLRLGIDLTDRSYVVRFDPDDFSKGFELGYPSDEWFTFF